MENIISQIISVEHLYEYIGKETAIELMNYVDEINVKFGGAGYKNVFHIRYTY